MATNRKKRGGIVKMDETFMLFLNDISAENHDVINMLIRSELGE